MKMLAFLAAAVFLFVIPVCAALADGVHTDATAQAALRLPEPTAVAIPSSGDEQAVPPADGDEGGPGSGPPAGMTGSSLISALMVAGVVVSLAVAGILLFSISKKTK
jgi:hypothetical protein